MARHRSRPLAACLLLAACSVTIGLAQTAAPYLIGIPDVLRVTVWSQPDLTGQYTVGPDGTITLPLIGAVQATGRTAEQLADQVRAKLADGFLTNPQVVIEVATYNSKQVYLVGEVRTPGAQPLSGQLTLIEALARAGSLTEMAGGDMVVLRRPPGSSATGPTLPGDPGVQEVARFDVREFQARGPSSNLALQDGDTVVVSRAELVYITGQVNNPGSYPFQKDMTVLQVISRAGGINELGTNKRVKIIRVSNGQKQELKATLADKVQPGDTIVIPTRFF